MSFSFANGSFLHSSQLLPHEIYNDGLKDQAMEIEWQDDYEAVRYTYISQLVALAKQRSEVEIQEKEIRKRREQMFPISFEDFKRKATDIQLRAARFLVADMTKQERMFSEFNWAWRQVQPLKDVFIKDVSKFLPFLFFSRI